MRSNRDSDNARINALRERGEELLRSEDHSEGLHAGASLEEVLHELDVYRAELEVQNDELREAQESLNASLNAQSELFEYAPVAYLLLDTNGVVLRGNHRAAALLGVERRRLPGRPLLVFLPREAHEPALHHRLAAVRSSPPPAPLELPLAPRDGRRLWVRMDSTRHSHQDDGPVCLTSLVDITARKTAELQLSESERRHRTLVNSLPDISYIYSAQHGGLFYSPQVRDILGYTPEHLLTHPELWHDSIHPEDRPAVQQAIEASRGRRAIDLRYRICNASGEWRWLHDRSMEISDPDGQVQIHGVARDITAQMLLEQELQRNEERLSLALRGANNGLWDWNMETNEVYYSPRWKGMLGYAEDELAHQFETWAELTDPNDRERAWETLNRYIAGTTDHFDIEFRMRHKDGHWVDIHSRAFLLRRDGDDKPVRVVGTHEDISQRKAQEALLSARARLGEAAAGCTRVELMQRFLDEAELLTESSIGFFHLLEADQETLSLQAWSTNTLKRMCTAEGSGDHYAVQEAGVWVDAVRRREPVIHNDYAGLPHKKGMPDGHAPVQRELVVPVFRDGQIVSVLGVGNKLQDYNEEDVARVSRLADTAWDLISRRMLEEELSAANDTLQERNSSLEKALEEIRTLRGIIPICSHCKSIRDAEGSWEVLEAYVSAHSHAEFSHGMCPNCVREFYPDIADEILEDGE